MRAAESIQSVPKSKPLLFMLGKGISMSLDKIVILVLALILFGGVAYLALKNRKQEREATRRPENKPSGPKR
jgi:hypothetical protein